MGFRLKWVFLALLAFVAGQPEHSLGELPKIRIGLLVGRESVSFAGPAGVTIQSLRDGTVLAWAPPGERWTLTPSEGGVLVSEAAGANKGAVERGVRLLPPEGGVVTVCDVGGHWDGIADRDYRGTIEVLYRGRDSLTVVNSVEIETYLRGVVPSEMPADYPLAALQAQAVAARGQALIKAGRHRGEGFDLCATPHCQVYGGATSESETSDQAVATTWGQVLEYQGWLADTLYSSTCGGHTANNEDYWPGQQPVPYLRGVPDYDIPNVPLIFPLADDDLKQYLKYAPAVNCNQPWHGSSSKLRWWSVAPREELAKTLAEESGDFGELLDVRITDRADSGLVREVAVVGTEALQKIRGGSAVRRAFGGLNSASFAVERIGEGEGPPVAFAIWGAGWGHQVGMCQVGAAGLADIGWDYRSILSKYYTGCEVVRRY